ncbi:MAG TPA: hypothetical protein VLI04_15775 [Nocardioidaceae bacterium]|nr:hypothetical protein [Nocardioidaceae bacterium]
MSDELDRELRTLARGLVTRDPSPELAARVADRVASLPVPRRTVGARLRTRAGWIVAGIVGLLGTTLAVSPVGATVAEWFGFHGVMVREDVSDLTGDPVVPVEPNRLSLEEAADIAGFRPLLPDAIGAPDGISARGDLVSLSWRSAGGTVRLDEFRGSLEPTFWKTAPDSVLVEVDDRDALWFPTAHEVVVVPDAGTPQTLAPRLAAPTLVWLVGDLTLRLEGDLTLSEAVAFAESVH